MNTYSWYAELLKPEWAPPAWLFGPVWSVLYLSIAISFGIVGLLFIKKQIPPLVALPFLVNIVANFAFSLLQFILQSNILASVDILIVLASLVWAMWTIYPYKRWIAYIQIPYLLWVSFATVLQFTITYLNL